MANYDFSSLIGTSTNFSSSSDTLTIDGTASGFRFANDGSGNLVVSDASTGSSATLLGITLAAISSSIITFTSGSIFAGDNTNDTSADSLAQEATEALDLVDAASIYLDAGNLIYGMGDGDTITAGNGNNVIFGGSGYADSADGSDSITMNGTGATSGSNAIYGNGGNDTIIFTDPTGSAASSTVYGGLGNDHVITGATAGSLLIYMGAGNDTVAGTGADGSITVYGGSGAVDSTDGNDVITSGIGEAFVYGNAGTDNIAYDDFAADVTQYLYGGLGNDTLTADVGGTGSLGNLYLYGGAGDDSIDSTLHLGDVTIYGGIGAVDSTDGADTILVGASNANYNAIIYGNAGADTITTSASMASGESITINAGLGADTINITGARSATSTLNINGNDGNDIINVDDSSLTADADVTFTGFESTDIFNITLSGGTATDLTITGLGSSVTITNGAGNGDYLFTNYTGNFNGTNFSLSDDSILLTNLGGSAIALTGGAHNDQIICGLNGDSASGAAGDDIIRGGDGADSITAGDGIDTVTAGAGNDTVNAGDGGAAGGTADSSIHGGEGSDSIIGGIYEDSIDGSTGNDTIVAGAAADTITGGEGADVFGYLIATTDTTDTNVDLINDAFTGYDAFDFTDLTNTALRGTGVTYAEGTGTSAQTLGTNVGLYVATNAAASFAEADIYTALSGIADDFAASDMIYVMISDGTDARLVRITESANVGTLAAADDTMTFVARLSGVSTTDLTALSEGNFADFV